jgi:hypothetical protein
MPLHGFKTAPPNTAWFWHNTCCGSQLGGATCLHACPLNHNTHTQAPKNIRCQTGPLLAPMASYVMSSSHASKLTKQLARHPASQAYDAVTTTAALLFSSSPRLCTASLHSKVQRYYRVAPRKHRDLCPPLAAVPQHESHTSTAVQLYRWQGSCLSVSSNMRRKSRTRTVNTSGIWVQTHTPAADTQKLRLNNIQKQGLYSDRQTDCGPRGRLTTWQRHCMPESGECACCCVKT